MLRRRASGPRAMASSSWRGWSGTSTCGPGHPSCQQTSPPASRVMCDEECRKSSSPILAAVSVIGMPLVLDTFLAGGWVVDLVRPTVCTGGGGPASCAPARAWAASSPVRRGGQGLGLTRRHAWILPCGQPSTVVTANRSVQISLRLRLPHPAPCGSGTPHSPAASPWVTSRQTDLPNSVRRFLPQPPRNDSHSRLPSQRGPCRIRPIAASSGRRSTSSVTARPAGLGGHLRCQSARQPGPHPADCSWAC